MAERRFQALSAVLGLYSILFIPLKLCVCAGAAGMTTDAFADFVVGHGELWCAQLLAAACRVQGANAEFMDTREILVRLTPGLGFSCRP